MIAMQLINDYDAKWIDNTLALIEAVCSKDDSLHVYLLVDAAFKSETAYRQIRQLLPKDCCYSLYEDVSNISEQVRAVSPLLITVEHPDNKWVAAIGDITSGQPMLSLIVSSLSMKQLWEQLAVFRYVGIDDGRYVLRFSDTRRLPELFAVFTDKQRAFLTHSITQWRYIGRNGQWNNLPIAVAKTEAREPMDRLVFDDQQTEAMLAMNGIDALIDGLRQNDPELYNVFATPFQRYQWIKNILTTAVTPVTGFSEQMTWCREAAVSSGMLAE